MLDIWRLAGRYVPDLGPGGNHLVQTRNHYFGSAGENHWGMSFDKAIEIYSRFGAPFTNMV